MGSSTPSAVFSRHCSFRLSLVPIDDACLSTSHHMKIPKIDDWIASKDEAFFRHGIHMLPERWEKVVASDGYYFE